MLLGLIGAASWAIWWAALSELPICSLLIAIPLIAGMVCLFVKANAARWIALIATLIDLALGAWLWARVRPGRAAMAVRREAWRLAAASTGRSASTASP